MSNPGQMNTTVSVAIMSGKGGVGKTNAALNLSCALHGRGAKTLLIDCDMGLANLDVLLGVTPEENLENVLKGRTALSRALHPVTPDGFDLLPAASGMPELIDMTADMRDLFLQRLEPVLHHYEYVFMDLGAGIAEMVQAFAAMAAMRIIIITPEPTALTDSYALVKVITTRYNIRDYMVLVNQVDSRKEADLAFKRLQGACNRFLGVDPVLLGYIRNDSRMADAVRNQTPLLNFSPDSRASRDIILLAGRLERIKAGMADWLAPRPVLLNNRL